MKKLIGATLLLLVAWTGNCMAAESGTAPPFEQILKIDVHSHIFEDIPVFVEMMRRTDLRIVNICVRGNNLQIMKLMEERAESIHNHYPRQFYFASTFDLTKRNEPDYAEQVTRWLDKSFEAGALMTKIWKEVGMELKTPTGEYLMPDDPVLDPVYSHLAKRGKPLLAHLAEPVAAWLPLDPDNVHYGYYSNHPEWHVHGREGFPGHETILAARDRILEKHPDLIFIGAHCGSMSHDVGEIAKRLDRYPNFYVEVSARTKDLSRQPAEKVRKFFIKYQDRIMYGTDYGRWPDRDGALNDEQQVRFTENMEKMYRTHYKYYAGSGKVEIGGKEVDCLNLPRTVLEKFYYKNAQRLIPGLAD